MSVLAQLAAQTDPARGMDIAEKIPPHVLEVLKAVVVFVPVKSKLKDHTIRHMTVRQIAPMLVPIDADRAFAQFQSCSKGKQNRAAMVAASGQLGNDMASMAASLAAFAPHLVEPLAKATEGTYHKCQLYRVAALACPDGDDRARSLLKQAEGEVKRLDAGALQQDRPGRPGSNLQPHQL